MRSPSTSPDCLPQYRRSLQALIASMLLGMGAAAALAQPTPVGVWKTVHESSQQERSLVRITHSDGVLTGVIEKLLDPALPANPVCAQCSGERRDKPLLGMVLIQGVRRSPSDPRLWDGGEILDPHNGKLFAVRLVLADGGKRLEVRGYLGTPMVGRSQNWYRVE